MRLLLGSIVLGLLPLTAALAGEEAPQGWTVTVQRLEGSERRPWHLALVFHEGKREVTLVVTPSAQAGTEAAGIDAERVERSDAGDLHQIALWAEQLRRDAEGWKRPSLRERPPPSAHVIGVVRSLDGSATVVNAEHGGGELTIGDLLFVEDVLTSGSDTSFGIELLGGEDLWQRRVVDADLLFGHNARVGLRGTSRELLVYVHRGITIGTSRAAGLQLRTDRKTYAPVENATFLLTRGNEERLDVKEGEVQVGGGESGLNVAAGSAVAVEADGSLRVAALDSERWEKVAPRERPCTREEALRLVDRVRGTWRGEPRSTMVTLVDDGRWRSYERQPGRSINKSGTWEPRPGGIVELTYVWTPHRSRTKRTDVFRYLRNGEALHRLEPGGPVLLLVPPK